MTDEDAVLVTYEEDGSERRQPTSRIIA